jgi:hypothetical protein
VGRYHRQSALRAPCEPPRSRAGRARLIELPKGGSTCETITLSQSVEYPGGIQWYGKYLAVGDQEAHVIYHFAIHGTSAKEITTGGSSDVVEFYIQKPYVVGADAGNNDVGL